MPPAKYQKQDIHLALEEVVPDDTDTVFMISRLWTFAHRLDCPPRDAGRWLLDAVQDFLGEHRTLVLSGYTYSYGRTRLYDPTGTKPETGAMAQAAFESGSMVRTLQPMMSHFVCGPRAKELLAHGTNSSFGTDGGLGWITEVDARVCVLGMPESNMGWVICHHAEEISRVPYRYFKRLPGHIQTDGGVRRPCSETAYVRAISGKPDQDWSDLNRALAGRGEVLHHQGTGISLRSASSRTVRDTCVEMLTDDPYRFFNDPDAARSWVQEGRQAEIDSLKPDERPDADQPEGME